MVVTMMVVAFRLFFFSSFVRAARARARLCVVCASLQRAFSLSNFFQKFFFFFFFFFFF